MCSRLSIAPAYQRARQRRREMRAHFSGLAAMTKVRPPASFEEALIVIKEHVGWDLMASTLGKAISTIQDYADQHVATDIGLKNASKLEKLYRLAGGQGYPISDCMRLRARMAEDLRQDDSGFVESAVVCIRENGDASSAVARLLLAGDTPAERAAARADAIRELAQSVHADTAMLRRLRDEEEEGAAVIRPPP